MKTASTYITWTRSSASPHYIQGTLELFTLFASLETVSSQDLTTPPLEFGMWRR